MSIGSTLELVLLMLHCALEDDRRVIPSNARTRASEEEFMSVGTGAQSSNPSRYVVFKIVVSVCIIYHTCMYMFMYYDLYICIHICLYRIIVYIYT